MNDDMNPFWCKSCVCRRVTALESISSRFAVVGDYRVAVSLNMISFTVPYSIFFIVNEYRIILCIYRGRPRPHRTLTVAS